MATGAKQRVRARHPDPSRHRSGRDLPARQRRDADVVHAVCREHHRERGRPRDAKSVRESGRRDRVGPNSDGSGGASTPTALSRSGPVGTNLVLQSPNSACVTARIFQTSTAASAARTWSAALNDVSLIDEQGPSVSGVEIRGTEANGWFTGPIDGVLDSHPTMSCSGERPECRSPTGRQLDLGDAEQRGAV